MTAAPTIDSVGGPDLERTADGFKVSVYFRPSLAAPTSAVVFILDIEHGPLDVKITDAVDAYDVFAHPAIYSARYAHALTERAS